MAGMTDLIRSAALTHYPEIARSVGLDPNQIREIRTLIRELGSTGSVILSTHILSEVEAICDRVQIMHHGRIVYRDTIAALKDQTSLEDVFAKLTQ